MNDTPSPSRPAAGAGAAELVYDDAPAPPGRPVRLVPTARGFWRLVLGALVALLAPFFGILVGSTMGAHDESSGMDPLYWGFFIGGLIGAVGLVAAALGAIALLRHARSKSTGEQS